MFPLLLGGASLLASGIGAIGKKKAENEYMLQNLQADQQQMQQDQRAAQLRNEVLGKYRANAREFASENQGNFNAGIAAFSPEAQASRLNAATGARGATISQAAGEGPVTDVPFRAGAPSTVRNEYNTQLGDAFTRAVGQGGRLASVGAYGDMMGANARDISGTGQRVETVNTLAKGNASLLPYEQDLASYQANAPIFRPAQPDVPWWANLLQGGAKVGGAVAGRSF